MGLALLAPPAAQATPGDLDPSFGVNGISHPFETSQDIGFGDVAVTPSGRILVTYGERLGPDGLRVVALKPDGSVDETFGDSGTAAFEWDGIRGAEIGLDGQGRILVRGNDLSTLTVVARLHADGTLDENYGDDGFAVLFESFTAMHVRPGGAVILAGGATSGLRFARVKASGQLDDDFGSGGTTGVPAPPPCNGFDCKVTACDVVQAPGGKLVAVGATLTCALAGETSWVAARVLSDGLPDPSFGGDIQYPGLLLGSDEQGFNAILNRDHGGLAFAGGSRFRNGNSINRGWLLLGLLDSGVPDPGFGTDGVTHTIFDSSVPEGTHAYTRELLEQSDGKLVTTGWAADLTYGLAGDQRAPGTMALARYDPDGSPDLSYGQQGIVRLVAPKLKGGDGAIDDADRIVVVGNRTDGSALVARFLPAGDGIAPDGSEPPPDGDGETPPAGDSGGQGGVAGGVDTNARNVAVHKVVVPKSLRKLLRRGIRVRASCEQACRILVDVRVTQEIANAMGLEGTLIARGSAPANAGQRRWVVARLTGAARRALASYGGGGRFQVNVTGVSR